MLRVIFQIISWAALAGIVAPPFLFALGSIDLEAMKRHLIVATIVWFIFTPLWMGQDREATGASTT